MKTKLLAGALMLAAVSLFIYLLIPNPLDDNWPTRRFSSDQWKQLAPKDRFVMVKDLLASGALMGKTTAEVEEMLGTPSYKNPRDEYWLYVVREVQPGEWSFDAVVMLDTTFDQAGRVAKAYVRSD